MEGFEFFFLSLVLIQAFIMGAFCAFVAGEKNRSQASWFLLGFLTSVAALLALIALPAIKQNDGEIDDQELLDDLNVIVSDMGKTGITLSTSDARTITSVRHGSPANLAGVQQGDRLVMIDGEFLFGESDYRSIILRLVGSPGTSVTLTVRRDKTAREYNVERV